MDTMLSVRPNLSALRNEAAAMQAENTVREFTKRWGKWFDGYDDGDLRDLSVELWEYVAARRSVIEAGR